MKDKRDGVDDMVRRESTGSNHKKKTVIVNTVGCQQYGSNPQEARLTEKADDSFQSEKLNSRPKRNQFCCRLVQCLVNKQEQLGRKEIILYKQRCPRRQGRSWVQEGD